MAGKFDGDPERMRRATTASLSRMLRVDPGKMGPIEQSAFEEFALVLSLVPELARWPEHQKQALIEIIRAKVSANEANYLRLTQKHEPLKEAMLRLGSLPAKGRSRHDVRNTHAQ